ncbi:MAG: S1 RNA-binding domain-containing protein [Oscillospiraceae bacterium]|nr:S1 RNA-binding domain-containing protein [Oscillospiraceae bacterium]
MGNRANTEYISSPEGLKRAALNDSILEARAVRCDAAKNLIVELGGCTGIIPRNETAIGAESGELRDIAIISQVGKPVCFKVTGFENNTAVLSRRAAQEEALETYMATLQNGDILGARVTHLEPFGAFVDIGCGLISLIGIENISISRISHPSDRFEVGQEIFAAVLSVDRETRRVSLTHRELLGTWEENAALFNVGETVAGIVRGIEEYGSFIELTPNLSGLTERREGLREGDGVSVYIKSINPERMKVKLLVIESFERYQTLPKLGYFITGGKLDEWIYSPASCDKKVISRKF